MYDSSRNAEPRTIWIAAGGGLGGSCRGGVGSDGDGFPSGSCGQVETALMGIADAQAEAMASQGRYGSYWLSGGDRT